MIDFIYRLNDVLPMWSPETKWSLKQISEATDTSLPHVLQFFHEGLCREVDISGYVSLDEATEAILLLSKKLQPQIEEREAQLAARRELAVKHYENSRLRINRMQQHNDWHTAFRTLCYVAGQYEQDLPPEHFINLCSEIIRCGIKSTANVQEQGQWLQKGIAVAMSLQSRDGFAEALDLIDAYGDYFLNESSGKGALLLGNLIAVLEEPSARFELWSEYQQLVNNLYPNKECNQSTC